MDRKIWENANNIVLLRNSYSIVIRLFKQNKPAWLKCFVVYYIDLKYRSNYKANVFLFAETSEVKLDLDLCVNSMTGLFEVKIIIYMKVNLVLTCNGFVQVFFFIIQ